MTICMSKLKSSNFLDTKFFFPSHYNLRKFLSETIGNNCHNFEATLPNSRIARDFNFCVFVCMYVCV